MSYDIVEITLDRIMEILEQDEFIGICENCGDERYCTEHDAEDYLCDNCGKETLFKE
jgi:ribosomal protein S27E